MKTSQIIVSTFVASLTLATASFATVTAGSALSVSQYQEHYKTLRTDVPLPVKVVEPSGLPWNYRRTTFNVTMLVDRDGRPQNIKIGSPASAEMTKLLVSAVSQWRFSPARENGVPVARLVTLPLDVKCEG